MSKFKRKTNYSTTVLEEAGKMLDDEFLVIPNQSELKAYYRGLTAVYKMTDSSFQMLGQDTLASVHSYQKNHGEKIKAAKLDLFMQDFAKICEDNADKADRREEKAKIDLAHREAFKSFFDSQTANLKKMISLGMEDDKERMTSQIISLNNMTFDENVYSVCGWEAVVPEDYAFIPSTNPKAKRPYKKPEIDLVVVNPAKRDVILVEYKCKGSSMLDGNQDIEHHCNDYLKVLHCEKIDEIKNGLLDAYNVLCKIKAKPEIEKSEYADYSIRVGFLFVDEVYDDKNTLISRITETDYAKGADLFDKVDESDVNELVYIRAKKVEQVVLNDWKKVKDSKLALTIPNR